MSYSDALTALKNARRVLVACHANPDGDTIGSMLALGLGLKSLGKEVTCLSIDGIPAAFQSLPDVEHVVRKLPTNLKFDLAVTVDCNSADVLGKGYSIISRVPLILEIDHHEFRKPFGQLRWVDKKAAAVGEMICHLLCRLGVTVTREIAEGVLTSIIVETNSFRLPSVRSRTFGVCAQLMKTGVDFAHLTHSVYWAQRKEAVILSGLCLSRCRFCADDRLVWSMIYKNDFDKVGGKPEDIDSVPDIMRSIDSVLVAVLFREESTKNLRVSLRSKKGLNVAAIAEQFAGGGHFDVAGCMIKNTRQAREKLLKAVQQLLKQHRR